MGDYNLEEIRSKLHKALDKKRYEHTLGVAYTAYMLAKIYEIDAEKALLAGYLHDCAKCINDKKKIKLCKEAGLEITDVEYSNPFLLHAKAGAVVAKEKYGIDDPDILDAIKAHTTGKPAMTTLEKIIYIADYIEPGRKPLPNLDNVRKLAFKDIDKALLTILSDILEYLAASGYVLDPMTQRTYDYYKEQEGAS